MTPENAAKLHKYFEDHKEEIRADILTLVRAESPSTNKEYADKCCEVVCRMIRERTGAEEIELFPQDTLGPMIQTTVGDGPKKILFMGHYDTVHNVGSVPLVDEGDIIRGPGVFDMKTGLVSFLWCIKSIRELGLPCDKTFVLFFNSDEELGSGASKGLYLKDVKSYRAAVVTEPAQGKYIKVQRKGAGFISITVTGRAAHAGSAFTEGRSAVIEASHLALYLDSLVDLEKGTTVNVGVIRGGERNNIVCPEVYMGVDYRVKTKAAEKELLEKILAYRPHNPDVKVEINPSSLQPPMEKTPENDELYRQLQETCAQLGMEIEGIAVGGGSDGCQLSGAGCPTIDGMGGVGANAHTVDEYLDFPASLERMKMLAAFMSDLV